MAGRAKHGGMRRLTPIASAVALTIFGAGLPVQAQAQQAGVSGAAPLQLETVVVTANRRIEKLEDVPMSITVLSDEYMQRNNVRDFVDIVNLSPALSVSVGTQVGTNSINMRGIGTTSNNVGIEGDIAVIIDDMPYSQAQQAFKDLSDVARIEVLKGPQTTLFGKSAIAGAVVITTKPIGGGPLKGNLSLFNTSDHEYRASASVTAAKAWPTT
jgi:iron complex outermembrane receptor protein